MYYVYIIQSESSGYWYYGSSHDPQFRLNQHNANTNPGTRKKEPRKIIFIRRFADKKSALFFERQLKKWRNKNFIQQQFKEFLIQAD